MDNIISRFDQPLTLISVLHILYFPLKSFFTGDRWHPMASIGMGSCNKHMSSSQTYNFGPSNCVADHYLDVNGCPNDVIQTSQWVKAGWTWAGNPIVQQQLNSKPRFTYDSSTHKCWDYSDCFCTGCGMEFKTDQSTGYGVTGYGFWYQNHWTSFASMSNTQRARQCSLQFNRMGYDCPASEVNLGKLFS